MKYRKFLVGSLIISLLCNSLKLSNQINLLNKEPKKETLEQKLSSLYLEIDNKFDLSDEEHVLLLDGKNQALYLVNKTKNPINILKKYFISTGKKGFGNEKDSFKTPTGIHKIKEKVGTNAPIGTIFFERKDTRKRAVIYNHESKDAQNAIVSRIMWIEGCEKDNINTEERYIYFHGTPQEWTIGFPSSSGCIRMKNTEIIELYNLVRKETYVYIKENI